MNNERKDCVVEMTNEKYREELRKIFDSINDNRVLRFWYRYVYGVEKGRD